MTAPGYGRHYELTNGTTLSLPNARGSTLTVTRGMLWLTQYGDRRDIVLGAGDTWTIERQGETLATALEDSAVALVGKANARVDARGRRRSWLERVVTWFDGARAGRRWVPHV